MITASKWQKVVNGVDTEALKQMAGNAAHGGRQAQVKFGVATHWRGGTKTETRVTGYEFAGRRVAKDFSILSDEPRELCGENTQPNPQELLMAAFNSCMVVGYVANAALRGIEIESVSIESAGELDLRGFLGLDSTVKPGYDQIHYVLRIKGSATHEQFQQLHETVIATSPNRWNIANPIKLTSELIVE
jgi:uncharacterized OsmC-like protein